uniref:centriolar coiled-coil protein of 110 kDa-like n=1 Tax=Pristiophorus japonicus TaxID=55135 RepID=UPI00398E9FF2
MESYEEFCKARHAQIKAKVNLEKSSRPTTSCGGSLIRFHGTAILSPLLSPEQRKEMQEYQLKAKNYSKTSKDKLHEIKTSMQLLEVHKLLNSMQLIKVPAIQEILEDYSFLMLPNMPVNTDSVKEMNSEWVEDWNTTTSTTTMHKTSPQQSEPLIFEPTIAQMSNEIEETYTTSLVTDHVPIIVTSDLINKKSGISNYQAGSSCLGLVASPNTRASSHINNGPKSDDIQNAAVHALQNVTVHKIMDTTTHKAINSTNKQENVCEVGSDGSIVISTGDKTSGSNSEHFHHPTDETNISQNLSPDTTALSLQSLLKKSREYRDRQRQLKLLKSLQFKVQGQNLSDKENDLDATKASKNTRGKRNDSGKTKLPNTLLNPDPALPSGFSPGSHTFSEHNQTFIASVVNTEKTNEVLCKFQILPKENKGTKINQVDPKNIVKFSRPLNKRYSSKRSPVHSNSGGQVSHCQEGGNNVNRSAKSQSRGFMVPNLALSKSPVFSKKWTCPSQKLLVNAPISVGSERIEQQEKESSADTPGDQPEINQAQTQYITELEVNLTNLKTPITGLQKTLTSSCEVAINEQLPNSEATLLKRSSESLSTKCKQEGNETADISVADSHWNKGHNDLRFLSCENSIPQTVNSAPAAFHASKLQSLVTQKMQCPSQQIFVQNAPITSTPQMANMTADRIAQNQSINKSYDVEFPSSLWTQDFKLKQEMVDSRISVTPQLGLNVLDHRVKRKLIMSTASDGQQQPVALTGSSRVSFHLHNLSPGREERELQSLETVPL